MKNGNTLVALAYIKTNENPLEVFCNYILYILLRDPDKKMRADELHEKLKEKFGLQMNQQMLNVCIRILVKKKEVACLPKGAGYHAIKEKINIQEFDRTFLKLHEQEQCVIENISAFVEKEYGQTWSEENTRVHLSRFLNEQGNASNLFLDEEIEEGERLSPSWYIGRYVDSLEQNKESLEFKYLSDIVNGMMIYQGLYQINDYEQDKKQKFKGTCFFFDTKLVLRAMGFSWKAQVEATIDLIDLIKKEYGGRVCVFDKTIGEVSNALYTAGEAYKQKKPIADTELNTYSFLNPTAATLLIEKADNVRELARRAGFEFEDVNDLTSERNKKYWIGTKELQEFIAKQHPDWREGTISNDVDVINRINILRKADYSDRYGGKNKLPVMITTNSSLVYSVKEYAQEEHKKDQKTMWNPHALPIISDNMLLFRLWVPVANKYSNLPAITLSRYAYSAQNADSSFFEKLRKEAEEYKKENDIDIISLAEARRKKLEDIIVEKTDGEVDNLTMSMVALGVDELIRFENKSLIDDLEEVKSDNEEKERMIRAQEKEIIQLVGKPFYDKWGSYKILLFLARWWYLLIGVTLMGIACFVSCIDVTTIPLSITAVVVFIIEVGLFIVGEIFKEKTTEKLLKKAVGKAVCWYRNKINKEIAIEEKNRKKILINCLKNTPALSKYKKYWPIIEEKEKEEEKQGVL